MRYYLDEQRALIVVSDNEITIAFPKASIRDTQRALNREAKDKNLDVRVYRKNGEWHVLTNNQRWDFIVNGNIISIPR